MTLLQDRDFQKGLAGSLLLHALLLLLFGWSLQRAGLLKAAHLAQPKPEPALIFPEQVIALLPPPPPPPARSFIRTTQNQAAAQAPANARFESDRNTVAASRLPPKAGGDALMPTLTGNAPNIRELANRDYRQGKMAEDAAPEPPANAPTALPQANAAAATPATMKASPEAAQPDPIRKVQDSPPPAPPPQPTALNMRLSAPPPPALKAENLPEAPEAPKTAPRRPEMVEPAPAAPRAVAATPPSPTPPKPQVREPQDDPPMAKPAASAPALQAPGQTMKDAFTPFTRTAKTEGGIQREGEDAVDAIGTPRGAYMRQVTGAVEQKWHQYVRLARDAVTFGRVRFRFYVDARGKPQDLQILSDARDADPRMRDLTLRAILDAAIPPMPKTLVPQLEEGRMKIEYEAIVY